MAEEFDTPKIPKRYGVFDATGNPQAFYGDDIYDGSKQRLAIPDDAVELTEEQYHALLNNQGLSRFVNGKVVILEAPPPPPPPPNPLDEIKAAIVALNDRIDGLEKKKHGGH